MSQYKGNNTSFEPNYSVAGETKTPINVVATSIEIDGVLYVVRPSEINDLRNISYAYFLTTL